jgi:hypothetical protein
VLRHCAPPLELDRWGPIASTSLEAANRTVLGVETHRWAAMRTTDQSGLKHVLRSS